MYFTTIEKLRESTAMKSRVDLLEQKLSEQIAPLSWGPAFLIPIAIIETTNGKPDRAWVQDEPSTHVATCIDEEIKQELVVRFLTELGDTLAVMGLINQVAARVGVNSVVHQPDRAVVALAATPVALVTPTLDGVPDPVKKPQTDGFLLMLRNELLALTPEDLTKLILGLNVDGAVESKIEFESDIHVTLRTTIFKVQ